MNCRRVFEIFLAESDFNVAMDKAQGYLGSLSILDILELKNVFDRVQRGKVF